MKRSGKLLMWAAALSLFLFLFGCGRQESRPQGSGETAAAVEAEGERSSDRENVPQESEPGTESMDLEFADQFSVEYLADGSAMVSIKDGGRFLVLDEGMEPSRPLEEDVAVIYRPLKNIYLAATSAMDLFCGLDALDPITLSGTEASGWYIEEAKEAMENGDMAYAGKYDSPDYELILSKGCDLAIEST